MSTSMIAFNVPDEIFLDLNVNEISFIGYAKRFIAFDLYQNKNISLGYCAELAKMAKRILLSFWGITMYQYLDLMSIV